MGNREGLTDGLCAPVLGGGGGRIVFFFVNTCGQERDGGEGEGTEAIQCSRGSHRCNSATMVGVRDVSATCSMSLYSFLDATR